MSPARLARGRVVEETPDVSASPRTPLASAYWLQPSRRWQSKLWSDETQRPMVGIF